MMSTGAVIAAASRKIARPIQRIGDISTIQRTILTFRKAGIHPIVVVTGFEEPEIKSELMYEGVIFLKNLDYEDPPLIESYKIGVDYLADKVDRVFLTPVNVPMFTFDTCLALMEGDMDCDLILPSYQERSGHPVLLNNTLYDRLIVYDGPDGLRGLMVENGVTKKWVEVDDPGVRVSIHQPEAMEALIPSHDDSLLQPYYRLGVRKGKVVFDSRTRLLLKLIDEYSSVSGACQRMSLSLSKAWKMVNELEQEVGYTVVERRQGGSRGGKTHLSREGHHFLQCYMDYESRVKEYLRREFDLFIDEVNQFVE